MELDIYDVRIKGTRRLLCHNAAQLSDPISPISKKMKLITTIPSKKKTDSHYEQLADLEYVGGLYLDDNQIPIITTECLEGMLVESARKYAKGKDFKAGIEVIEHAVIIHDGPKNATANDLMKIPRFRDRRGVKVGKSRLFRIRPCFMKWELNFQIQSDPEIIKDDQLKQILETGGRIIGLGDYRPHFGKFEVTHFKKVNS